MGKYRVIYLTEIDGYAGPDIEADSWAHAELIAMEFGGEVIGRWIYDVPCPTIVDRTYLTFSLN